MSVYLNYYEVLNELNNVLHITHLAEFLILKYLGDELDLLRLDDSIFKKLNKKSTHEIPLTIRDRYQMNDAVCLFECCYVSREQRRLVWLNHNLEKHSHNDKPADYNFQTSIMKWFKNGMLHRDKNRPAYVDKFSCQKWYYKNYLLRFDEGPTMVNIYGSKFWMINSRTMYCKYGKEVIHRSGKPAVIHADGREEYYEYNKRVKYNKCVKK